MTPIHPEGSIELEVRSGVLLIGINRPNKRNGFTPKMYRELGEAYTRLDDDPTLRVGVLHAMGEHFTAGLDLPTIAPLMQRGEKAVPLGLVDPLDLGMEGYRRRTKPMVVAVQGITYTLGIELMLAADIVVAADNCRFSQLEVKRGIMATGGATLRMAERAGMGNALLHLLTGDEFGSAEALRLNFVQRVVPAGEQLNEAIKIAEAIAAQAALGGGDHTPECFESSGARPFGGHARIHFSSKNFVQQRRRQRRRAVFHRKTRSAVHWNIAL